MPGLSEYAILYVIVACEVGFWLFLLAGLVSRYPLRRPRLGAVLLVCVPIVDLVLLAATVVDLRSGATANFAHGLAAVYIGFSVAFGHGLIRWADVRFAHRLAGGPPPEPKPKYGRAKVAYEWKEFGKAALAWGISCGLLAGAILLVNDPQSTQALAGWISRLSLALVVWFLFWPLWVTVSPPKAAS